MPFIIPISEGVVVIRYGDTRSTQAKDKGYQGGKVVGNVQGKVHSFYQGHLTGAEVSKYVGVPRFLGDGDESHVVLDEGQGPENEEHWSMSEDRRDGKLTMPLQ